MDWVLIESTKAKAKAKEKAKAKAKAKAKPQKRDPYDMWREQAYCWLLCWKKRKYIYTRIDKNIANFIAVRIPVDMSWWRKWDSFGYKIRLGKSIFTWCWMTVELGRYHACKKCLRPCHEDQPNVGVCSKGHKNDITHSKTCECGQSFVHTCDSCFYQTCEKLHVYW